MKRNTISRIEACIRDIKIWMTNNLLQLSNDKTKRIVITTHSKTNRNKHIAINIRDPIITPCGEPARDPVVLTDSTHSLDDMCLKLAKVYIFIACIPLGKFENTLIP